MGATKQVLVVDDNRLNSHLLSLLLQRLGLQAQSASSGPQALAMLGDGRFDLVILDLRMPEMNGERVCREIRDRLGLTALPVVACTAHRMPTERDRALAGGFDALLCKPVALSDLRGVCTELLKGGW